MNECLLRNPPIVACAIAAGALLAVAFGAVPNASLFRIPLVGNIGHIDDVFITAAVPLLLIAAAGGASILVTATRGHAVVVALLTAMVAFVHDDVLWPALVDVSALARDEADYINVQQGTRCERCGANVRSQALARAIVGVLGDNGTLESSVRARLEADLRILEINEAGALTPWLSQRRGHVLGRYPECDITNLHYPEGAFDLVVHSDTLEHIEDPRRGLAECRRVLSPGGACVFTVPIVIGRLTRSRQGLPPSYHGHEACCEPDFLVHTEYGADVWTSVFETGFDRCEIVPFRYPAGLALIAWAG